MVASPGLRYGKQMKPPIRLAVLTISDRCSAGEREDRSGPALIDAVLQACDAQCVATGLVPDEADRITASLRKWIDSEQPPDLILTTGGTGLSPRDVTPEATLPVIERRHDGLLELARMRCYSITPMTYLSRGVAGTAGRCLIINLPGSPRGACEMIEAMIDVLPHAIQTLRGTITDEHPV